MDYAYSSNIELADECFKEKNYGGACCYYRLCLKSVQKYEPENKQKIEYLEHKIKKCDELQ